MPRRYPRFGPVLKSLILASVLLPVALDPDPDPASPVPTAEPPPWPAVLYNPKPLDDDLILPLPCGGALTLRPVATPADSPRTKVVGPFTGSAGTAPRYLLIGKYEVTALQYQAVIALGAGQPCPPVAATATPGTQIDPRLAAQVGVSRIDAVNFAARLSRWLQANAERLPPCEGDPKPCLPRVDGKPAFVRLPLDLEWEYAARGGTLVSQDVFDQSRYPMPEGLERHAWYNRNSDGEIAPIGQRLPNPVGLHDLYGNAWEVMNDPYSSAAFPGQIGGDVLMGGGIHSADEELRADKRLEIQPYDAAGDVTTADTGFRVVLAAAVVTSTARLPAPASPPAVTPTVPEAVLAAGATADGRLMIAVDAAAMIYVDGDVKGAAVVGQPFEVLALSRGGHRIEARTSYAQTLADVELTDAEPVGVRIHLEQPPERAEVLLDLTSDDQRRVRRQLHDLGYPCDPASDRFDRGLRVVLKEFQRHSKLPVTGYLTAETRDLLERRLAERQRSPGSPAGAAAPAAVQGLGSQSLRFPERGPAETWMGPDAP